MNRTQRIVRARIRAQLASQADASEHASEETGGAPRGPVAPDAPPRFASDGSATFTVGDSAVELADACRAWGIDPAGLSEPQMIAALYPERDSAGAGA